MLYAFKKFYQKYQKHINIYRKKVTKFLEKSLWLINFVIVKIFFFVGIYKQEAFEQEIFKEYLKTGKINLRKQGILRTVNSKLFPGKYTTQYASMGLVIPNSFAEELNKHIMYKTVIAPEIHTVISDGDMAEVVDDNESARFPNESPLRLDQKPTQRLKSTIPMYVTLMTCEVPNASLDNSSFDIDWHLMEKLSDKYAKMIDSAWYKADGNGKSEGIKVALDRLRKTDTDYANIVSVSEITKQTLMDIYNKIPLDRLNRSKWCMNSKTWMYLKDLFIDEKDIMSADGFYMMGKPILINELMPELIQNEYPIIFGDMTAYVYARNPVVSIRRFDDSNYAEHDISLYLLRFKLGGRLIYPERIAALEIV